jgi:hypothetical protein
MHMLYVAAHATTVALSGYVTDLQSRLEVGARRRQPLAERPIALEITEAQGMIGRFDGFEQLAAAYLSGQSLTFGHKPADQDQSAFQGIHALSPLILVDEVCRVPKSIFDAVDAFGD